MFRFNSFQKFQELLAPPDDKVSGGTATPEMSLEDTIEFLGSDDEEETLDLEDKKEVKESKSSDDDKSEEPEEDDELKEIEEELEEPDDEKLEFTTPVARREILKKYPTLFKDFPYLEKAYYREREFTEIFPTIDDARETAEKAQTLDRYESDLLSGNIETALEVIKKESPKNFNKVVDNYLSTLSKIDEKAYHHVIGNTIKYTIQSMVQEARNSNNEVLQNAAVILNQFVFGSSNFSSPTKLTSDQPEKEDEEKVKLEKERQEFTRGKFEDARDGLNTRVNNTLRATIDSNIDPKDSMGPYVKKAATAEAFNDLIALVDKDPRFTTLKDRLWENAFKNNFSKDSLDKIRQAYLSKSKTLLPSVIKKARIEALRGIGKRVRDDSQDDESESGNVESKTPKTERRSAPTRERNNTKSGGVPKGMTTLEFLNQD